MVTAFLFKRVVNIAENAGSSSLNFSFANRSRFRIITFYSSLFNIAVIQGI
jgi:hypothetical protein